ncbi:hypothetical protein AB4Y89_10015 [Terriglobus sp. 2YAB30_2]|uniref:hypothetical protein n=1 Tax=Terriglobus sp. 2YAB30_2 TaxID=3233023 RepID=UPI003F97811A
MAIVAPVRSTYSWNQWRIPDRDTRPRGLTLSQVDKHSPATKPTTNRRNTFMLPPKGDRRSQFGEPARTILQFLQLLKEA